MKVPPLAFALGAYLPMEINTPVLIGSLISAVLHIGGIDWFLKDWVVTPGATYLGIVAYLVMCAVIYTVACKVKKASH